MNLPRDLLNFSFPAGVFKSVKAPSVVIVLAARLRIDSKAVFDSNEEPALAGEESLGSTTNANMAVNIKTTTASVNVNPFTFIFITVQLLTRSAVLSFSNSQLLSTISELFSEIHI